MNQVFLLLGSNVGDRKKNFDQAKELLEKFCGPIRMSSSLYETEAWGKTDQPSFLNQALEIETKFNAHQLMEQLLRIEKEMGRERREKYGPRLIDIDILLFNKEQHNDSFVQIPHPGLPLRRFALTPLAEIAPAYQHPVSHKTILQLLKECPDDLHVMKCD